MGYMVDGKKYNYNSIANQEIKRKFVEREVYCCVTSMTTYILSKSWDDREAPFSYDDITNFYKPVCPECGSSYGFEEIEVAYQCGHWRCDTIFENKPEICPECEDEEKEFEEIGAYKCENCGHLLGSIDDLDTEPQEIYEWWMVSGWFAQKLADIGECVLHDEGIWGRGCTGQAILLDWVISRICYDMEILEGQKYEWKVA